nr:hypothetical protein [Micromonospora sp. DSM 115978]
EVPARLGVVVVDEPTAAPDGLALAVLHDASPSGMLLLDSARRSSPGRHVVDAGIRPATVMRAPNAVLLRNRRLRPNEVESLRAHSDLTGKELDWLARGWWSPLAAVRPAQLVAVVEQVAARAEARTDPDCRRAYEVSFMSWPEPVAR